MKLLRKSYLKSALKAISTDISIFDELIGSYQPCDVLSLQKHCKLRFKELNDRYFDYFGNNAKEWADSFIPDEFVHPEHLKNTTSEGYSVRSKSELIIMGRLEHFNIPFRYEYPLELDNGDGRGGTEELIPDFTIMRPRDNKVFYWEHFGLMDDYNYAKRFRRKRWLYEHNGITEWDNLIITFDEPDGGINQMLVDAQIAGRLL